MNYDNSSVYEETFDRPAYLGEPSAYFICCAPRVGSWLLCDMLFQTGLMGVPAEYFNSVTGMRRVAERFGLLGDDKADLDTYIEAVKRHRTTSNGVFAAKIQYWMMPPLIQNRTFSKHFPNARFVYVSRHDVIAQGVSYEIARQTGQWISVDEKIAPEYDEMRVCEALDFVLRERASWDAYFPDNDIEPFRTDYETLIGDTNTVCRGICEFVGVETDSGFSLDMSHLRKQRYAFTDEWIEKVRALGRY